MKIAFDGGAFQQGIAAGIFNVAVGLMNEIGRQAPRISFVLVTDPRFGPLQPSLLARLRTVPEVVEGAVAPSLRAKSRSATTSDPRIIFEVDGRIVEARHTRAGAPVYEGSAPRQSFRIRSRHDRPRNLGGSSDQRRLGIAIREIRIRNGAGRQTLRFDDPRLRDGFHSPEGGQRWTNGVASIPASLFSGDEARVELLLGGTARYRLAEGAFDDLHARLNSASSALELRAETAILEATLQKKGVEAFIANHFIPAQFQSIRTYSILYDIIPVLFPDFFFEDARRNFSNVIDVFRRSEQIFSISEASRLDLVRELAIPADRVTAVGIDIEPDFVPADTKRRSDVRLRYKLSNRRYILTVGTLEPRKNHARLIRAFESVASEFADYDLVIVGKPGWGTDDLHRLAAETGLSGRIRFLHDVPTSDLPALYSAAEMLAYPSLYEGFGLPVLEAMACRCPVLTSNRSSMPEIAGDAALLVDPTSVDEIADGLHRLMSDKGLRRRLVEDGSQRRTRFSWGQSARRVIDVLEQR